MYVEVPLYTASFGTPTAIQQYSGVTNTEECNTRYLGSYLYTDVWYEIKSLFNSTVHCN